MKKFNSLREIYENSKGMIIPEYVSEGKQRIVIHFYGGEVCDLEVADESFLCKYADEIEYSILDVITKEEILNLINKNEGRI